MFIIFEKSYEGYDIIHKKKEKEKKNMKPKVRKGKKNFKSDKKVKITIRESIYHPPSTKKKKKLCVVCEC